MTPNLPTAVLVHGAWHGGWSWQRFTPHLERRGFAVRTVELPSVGAKPDQPVDLSADSQEVQTVLDGIAGPVLLCGHSYAGMVISRAALGRRNVERLVYVCAFMPEDGESLSSIGGGKLAWWIRTLGGGLTMPDPEQAGAVFYGDCGLESQQWAIRQLRPQSAAAFTEAVPHAAWKSIPSTYVICSNDKAIPAHQQRGLFAPRATEVVELESSHSPFMSHPAELADIFVRGY